MADPFEIRKKTHLKKNRRSWVLSFVEGIIELEFLQDVIHSAYKVDQRFLNCKKIASSIESIARIKRIDVAHLIPRFKKKSFQTEH
jgi:hypothetical protein